MDPNYNQTVYLKAKCAKNLKNRNVLNKCLSFNGFYIVLHGKYYYAQCYIQILTAILNHFVIHIKAFCCRCNLNADINGYQFIIICL